jgi:S-adenosylmethionine/arginine decarboxylase-like enzyme
MNWTNPGAGETAGEKSQAQLNENSSDKDYKGWPHLMVSGFGCKDKRALNNLALIYDFLKALPEKIGMHALGGPIVYRVTKKDHPDIGVTGIQIIATSHIAIHTFPLGQHDGKRKPRGVDRKTFGAFFTFDIYSCKGFDPDEVVIELKKTFKPKFIETALVYRLREDEEQIEVEDY